ncbi:diacylglycerol kinase [Wenjunlia tyrosinilytica]|uniref:Diacylglycerol kinase n=1 Tax=Wenjunlia tyrosinilytica TaxID=1544741 RepID=A0A917ZHV4_9ACTN|nr:diacylglycerol kinase [Wenjunlia tyrosinilytica]GGO82792.1 diacylglycerol kinase [Wenjunlia tyrosinilytica]
MRRDVLLFVNPTAGRGRGARAAEPVSRVLRRAGFTVRGIVGTDADDALARLREAAAAGDTAVVAVGGDGMVGLALQAVAGTATPLGVVAAGTGNDFARAVGLPFGDPEASAAVVAEALKEERTRAVDLGRVGERWFGTVMAAGLDSRVNDRANRMRLARGRFCYNLALLAELGALRPIPFRIRLDAGPEQEVEATLVAIGNGPSYGGGMRICSEARLDDGRFDITVVGRCGRTALLRVFPRVYKGTHLDHPAVTVHRAATVRLTAPGVTGYADGEPLGALPLTAETVPEAVRVLA